LTDHTAAGALYREALAALDGLSAEQQAIPAIRNSRSSVLIMLGENMRGSGDLAGARAALEQARQIRDQLWKEDPRNALLLRQRIDPYEYLLHVGNQREQLEYYQVLDSIYKELLTTYSANESLLFDFAYCRARAANLTFELGRTAEALAMAQNSIPELKRIALTPQALAIMESMAASILLDIKVPGFQDPKLALELAKRADSGYGSRDADTLSILARAYWTVGDAQEANRQQERALGLMETASPLARHDAEQALARYRQERAVPGTGSRR
jgi:hypothetical protein